jgi:hypothetical protein
MTQPIASITGNRQGGYSAEIWTAHGSCIHESHWMTAQQAHDAVEAILPGVETHWYVAAPSKPAIFWADGQPHNVGQLIRSTQQAMRELMVEGWPFKTAGPVQKKCHKSGSALAKMTS